MSSAAALTWFARHEIRLAWREWLAMIAGRRGKRKRAIIALTAFVVSCICRPMR
jgi:ABC-2 type transport system permease protein